MTRDARVPPYRSLPELPGGGHCGWHVFGAEDNVGRLNLQTPARVAAAAGLVRRGAVFALNAPVDVARSGMMGRSQPRRTSIKGRRRQVLDDVIDNYYPQVSSHWDALGHVAAEPEVFYNGATSAQVVEEGRNTIDHWARRGIAGRAVLLDVEPVLAGRDPGYHPDEPVAIGVEDLELSRRRAGVEFRSGDVLLLHTGFLKWYTEQDAATQAGFAEPGGITSAGIAHTEEMAQYLWDSGASAVAADNPGLEVWPPGDFGRGSPFGFLHRMLLARLGFAIGELWWLQELAQDCRDDGVYEMFFGSAPLNLPGGFGSPANAIAIK